MALAGREQNGSPLLSPSFGGGLLTGAAATLRVGSRWWRRLLWFAGGLMVPVHLDLQLPGSAYIGRSYRKWKSLTRT